MFADITRAIKFSIVSRPVAKNFSLLSYPDS